MILFCLSNAGGCASSYEPWKRYTEQFTVYPIEYAGHGKKCREEYYKTISEGVIDMYHKIEAECGFKDYSIFGHSMGAIFAYELYYYIKSKGKELPLNIFFAGAVPPNKVRYQKECRFSDEKIIRKLVKSGGIQKAIAKNESMSAIISQNIKNDYRIINTFHFRQRDEKIKSNVILLYGKKELGNLITAIQWNRFVYKRPVIKLITGNHYFVYNEETVRFVSDVLADTVSQTN